MNKKFFYVNSYDNMQPELSDNLIYKLEVEDINSLAAFAITLEPLQAETEPFGYAAALFMHYQKNNDNHKDCYTKLSSSGSGREFLCTTIQLCLFEKTFRENGIHEEMIERYNRVASSYQKQLMLNNKQYDSEQTMRKSE